MKTALKRPRRKKVASSRPVPRFEGEGFDLVTREQAAEGLQFAAKRYGWRTVGEVAFCESSRVADRALVDAVCGGHVIEIQSEGYLTPTVGEAAAVVLSAALFGKLVARAYGRGHLPASHA
jgi:hypothetical protein